MSVSRLTICATMLMTTSLSGVAGAVAQPEPMEPVDPGRRRIVERDRDDDRDRDRDRDDDRDRDGRRDDGDRDRLRGPEPAGRRPRSINEGQWLLGVTGDDTDVGVRVRSVVRGSAADRAGFERDDLIVNVGGYQVGIVDGRRYDLGDELQRRADRAGRATMLIQNRRDRSLRNVVVKLDWQTAQTAISGTVSYRERIAIPGDAVCFVELHEVDFAGRPLRQIAKQAVPMRGAANARFDLAYDRRDVDSRRRYAVTARIEAGGRTWFETRDVHYVLTQGAPDRIDIVLERSGGRVIRRRP